MGAGAKREHQKASEQGYVFHGIFLFFFFGFMEPLLVKLRLSIRPTTSFPEYTDEGEKGLSRKSKEVVNLC